MLLRLHALFKPLIYRNRLTDGSRPAIDRLVNFTPYLCLHTSDLGMNVRVNRMKSIIGFNVVKIKLRCTFVFSD